MDLVVAVVAVGVCDAPGAGAFGASGPGANRTFHWTLRGPRERAPSVWKSAAGGAQQLRGGGPWKGGGKRWSGCAFQMEGEGCGPLCPAHSPPLIVGKRIPPESVMFGTWRRGGRQGTRSERSGKGWVRASERIQEFHCHLGRWSESHLVTECRCPSSSLSWGAKDCCNPDQICFVIG